MFALHYKVVQNLVAAVEIVHSTIKSLIYFVSPPVGVLLSSSCRGLHPPAAVEGPFGPKGDFARLGDSGCGDGGGGIPYINFEPKISHLYLGG